MKEFPIVFACDDKYIKYTSVTIASIISNIKYKNIKYKFYILTQGISRRNQEIMNDFISRYRNCTLDFIIMDNIEKLNFPIKDYYSVEIYFRFFIPNLLKKYDRVLYLDSDIVVETDISELLYIDFENNSAIAVQDTKHAQFIEKGGEDWYTTEYFYNVLKLDDPKKYFNSGMILFNIEKMNREDLTSKLFSTLFDIGNPKMLDQDILNSVLTRWGGVKLISKKYNFMTSIRINPFRYSYKEVLFSCIKKIFNLNKKEKLPFFIYHFVEAAKPWKSQRPDRMLFYKYLYSMHEVNPPKEFVEEIIKENNRHFPIWWRLFMRFFS
ncbi:glycosyltransferase family 8 protein [Riemerella anatipestifer]|uniref:glycosyltransferase family 8 protein n=1 Tax=Riemerella anatipestifer TaxID=34085 RepID=UPI0013752B8D|nr:glycosyltransferase family 8 protein [Riemerella anatipestifer]